MELPHLCHHLFLMEFVQACVERKGPRRARSDSPLLRLLLDLVEDRSSQLWLERALDK